jgi:transposase
MNQVSTIGFDIAKHVFQVHGTDAQGRLFKRKLRRKEVLAYFASLPPSLIGMEACGSAHYWARKLQGLAMRCG